MPLFFLVFFALSLAGVVSWIVALVEVARIPDQQFRAAISEKIAWILIVVLTGFIGALIWWFAKRRHVLDAAGRPSAPPPGVVPGVRQRGRHRRGVTDRSITGR